MKIIISILMIAIILFSFSSIAMASSDNKPPKDDLVRIDFKHPAKENAAARAPQTSVCYKLMGVKWTSLPVSYIINPVNPTNLSEGFITSAISTAAETWDVQTSKELFNNAYTIDYTAKYGVQNYKNEIVFGDYSDPNTIAITSVWYSKRTRQIVEFDMLFNTKYLWGDATVNPSLMDLSNIATHELGHSIGLSDLYTSSCSLVTMYGYSNYGDVAKRTLEQPDITGLRSMYGN